MTLGNVLCSYAYLTSFRYISKWVQMDLQVEFQAKNIKMLVKGKMKTSYFRCFQK